MPSFGPVWSRPGLMGSPSVGKHKQMMNLIGSPSSTLGQEEVASHISLQRYLSNQIWSLTLFLPLIVYKL